MFGGELEDLGRWGDLRFGGPQDRIRVRRPPGGQGIAEGSPVQVSVVRELACPARWAISSTATPELDMTETNVCLSSRGAHTPVMPAFLHRARNPRRT